MRYLALALLLLLVVPGCARQPATQETVTVFAAASLTESFERIAEAYERAHPGVDVVFSFGGSSGLAAQLAAGAPADAFAAASPTVMKAANWGDEPVVFATNMLQIAVPAGNPGGVTGLADFANPDRAIALCSPEVPCGGGAATLFDDAGITPSVDTYEQDVKAVLTKISLGEVDAGIVYVTDVLSADGVDGIPIDSEPVDYPIAALTDRGHAFIDFVMSAEGQRILAEAGFGAP